MKNRDNGGNIIQRTVSRYEDILRCYLGAAVSMASLNYITSGGSRIKKKANSICSNVFSIGIPYDDTVGQKLNAGIIDGKRD